jgi:RecB family endonuclease NucS
MLKPVKGMFVAQVVAPNARVLAEARGFKVLVVDYDTLKGTRAGIPSLFDFLDDGQPEPAEASGNGAET